MEFLSLLSLIVFIALGLFLKVSKRRSYRKPVIRQTNNYQKASGSKASNPTTPPKKAESNAEIRKRLETLPVESRFRIIDGDTVEVISKTRRTRIRLDSIDCPEDGQEWGDKAKFGLIKLIGGKQIRLEEHGLDTHDRTLATIWLWNSEKNDWLNVNETMVMRGHAWVMRAYWTHLPKDRQIQLNRLESWAKRKRVGLWRADNPTPPWAYRHKNCDLAAQ